MSISLFSDIDGLKAMADFVLFFRKQNGKEYIIICNMKSKNKGNHANQVNAGKAFVNFLIESINRQFNTTYKIDFVRKVLFWEHAANKYTWKIYEKMKSNNNFEWVYQSGKERIDICNLDAICNT